MMLLKQIVLKFRDVRMRAGAGDEVVHPDENEEEEDWKPKDCLNKCFCVVHCLCFFHYNQIMSNLTFVW